MKRKIMLVILSYAVLIALAAAGSLQKGSSKPAKEANSPEGTWKMELYKYSSQTSEFNSRTEAQPRIKIITGTHFAWFTIDNASGRIIQAAGGTCKLNGNTYTENIDYGLGMESYLHTSNDYTIKVDGDMLFLSGDLSGYGKIEEIWHRVK